MQQIRQFDNYPELLPLTQNYPHIGCHMSISNRFAGLLHTMDKLNATSCAFFTSNVRGWAASLPNAQHTKEFIDLCLQKKIGRNQFLPHAPYLINLCSETEETRRKSYERLHVDAFIVRALGLDRLNFHPGSSKNKPEGFKTIAAAINDVHAVIPDVVLVLETMAGSKGDTIVGCSYTELKQIINLVKDKSRVGVCIDTHHTFAGAFVGQAKFGEDLFAKFDEVVGSGYLYGVHVNGSLTEYGSRVDRHAQIGEGCLSKNHIQAIMKQNRHTPHCLETPDEEKYADEIALLKKFASE